MSARWSSVRRQIAEGMSALSCQCPLVGTFYRLALSLTSHSSSARPLAGDDSIRAESQSVIEANQTKTEKVSRMAVVTLTSDTFSQKIEKSKGVALVDFWAPWCVPCRLVGPSIERLGEEFAGRVTIGKLNVDEHPDVAARFQVTGIPTVGVFRDGKLINRLVGVRPEQGYRSAIESALQAAPAAASAGSKAKRAAGHSVTVFSTPTCPWCARLKAYLREQRIAFKDVDVSRDAAAAQAMVSRSGQMGVPQAWIDGQVVVGFDRKRVDALLGLPTGVA